MPRAKRTEIIDLKSLSPKSIEQIRWARWKARTDLGWLCRSVLGFSHVTDNHSAPCAEKDGPDEPIHQPIIDTLQKFPEPKGSDAERYDALVNGRWTYRPLTPLLDLQGKRRVLILDSRGFLKTTINVVAHTIQWIINYPDIAIMVVQSNSQKAIDFLQKIKVHFQGNPKFRKLFPEHCPVDKPLEWGRQDRFITEARSSLCTRSEPTVMAGSIEIGGSGIHVDVLKFSDIVEPSNINGNGIELVKKNFHMMRNLLVSPQYWIDVEGTRYAYGDLYGEILETEAKRIKKGEEGTYKIYTRAVFKKARPDGLPQTFGPEELEFPCLMDKDGKRASWWPRRFPLDLLEADEHNNPETFATQQMNNPALALGTQRPFPVDQWESRLIDPKIFRSTVSIAYREICVDFAYTTNKRSDYTAIVQAAFTHTGRCFIERIEWGRMLPDESLKRLVQLIRENRMFHGDSLRSLKIEDAAYTHGIMPSLRRALDVGNLYAPVTLIRRDNDKSKEERILQTLQPWYKNKDLRFLADIDPLAMEQLKKELNEFPSGSHNDILDAVSDLFQDKEWFGRENPDWKLSTPEARKHFMQQQHKQLVEREWTKFIGQNSLAVETFDLSDDMGYGVPRGNPWHDLTGGL